jgi:HSP20 family protein
VDIPGVEKKDILVTADKETITISAERHHTSSSPNASSTGEGGAVGTSAGQQEYKRRERFSGHVTRTLTLPDGIDIDRIHADYHNGVLHVKIPKTHIEYLDHPKIIAIK